LCGVTRFTAEPQEEAGACHCEMCRKWSGGMFLSVLCGNSVRFENVEHLGSYKGSEWGERLFCKMCGSSLLWQTQDGENQHVSIQSFQNPEAFDLNMQVFIDCKPDNYALANETKTMTEAEVFAMFAPQSESN